MTPKDSAPLFTYTLTPREIPVGGSQPVTLTISVANETGKEQACRQIAFTLPPQLREGSISLSTTSDTWAISPGGEPGLYVAQPQGATIGLGVKERIGFIFSGVRPGGSPGGVSIDYVEETGEERKGHIDGTLVQGGPAITKFTADFLYVAPAAKVTFSWSAEGADRVVLDWGEGSHSGGSSGEWPIEPKTTVTATLTAFASGGAKRTAQLTVTVERPEVLSFSLEPKYVVPGTAVTLGWRTLFAQRCELGFHPTAVAEPEALGEVPPNADGYQQTVQRSGSFHLEAIGRGYTDSRQQPVTVYVPPVITMLAIEVDEGVCEGGLTRVTWRSTGGKSARLTWDGGDRGVDPNGGELTLFEERAYNFRLTFLSPSFGRAVASIGSSPPNQGTRKLTLSSATGINNPKSDVRLEWAPDLSGQVEVAGKSTPLSGRSANVTLPTTPPSQGPLWKGSLAGRGSVNWQVEPNAFDPSFAAAEEREEALLR